MRLLVLTLVLALASISSWGAGQERIAVPLEQLLKSVPPKVETPALVLLRKTLIEVNANYFAQSKAYVAILINSEEAVRDYSQMSLSFNSHYETLELEFADVRTPDGKIHSMEKDAVQIQNPAEENFYQDTKELTFSLPNVQVGSIIEFQYRRHDIKKIISGAWFDTFWFNWWEERAANQGPRLDPVNEAILEVRAPASLALFNQASEALRAQFSKKNEGDIQVLTWQQKNLPSIPLQNNMPRTVELFPMVQLSSLKSWQQVAIWGKDLFTPHIDNNERLQVAVNAIKNNASTPQEKLRQVYQFLQTNVRYVFAHVGRGGYEPHSATEVLANGYGDCKDQALLAVTLLRQLGIEAYPALVATRARGMPKLNAVTVAFDHMITYIPAQAGLTETWLDTAGEIALFPGFSTTIEGQPALIIKGDTDKLTVIKARAAQEHLAHLQLVFDKVTSQTVEAKFDLILGGFFEESLRSSWLFAPEKQKVLTDMLAGLYSSAELTQLSTKNAESLWLPFTVSGRFIFKNAWQGDQKPLSYGFNLDQALSVFSDLMHLHKPDERKQDFISDPGYKITTDILFLSPGDHYVAAVTSRGGNYHNPWFSVVQQGEAEAKNYRLRQSFLLPAQAVTMANYGKFYAAVKNLMEAPPWQVVFSLDDNSKSASKSLAKGPGDQDLITQARELLDQGNFAQALKVAEQAVGAAPKSGEAFYVLGLAQGYQDQVEAATGSFAKAKDLGFVP